MFRLTAASFVLVGCYASHEREPATDARVRDGGRVHDADTQRDSGPRDASRDAESRERDADTPPCSEARLRGEVRLAGIPVDDERHRIVLTAWFWPAVSCRQWSEAGCDVFSCDDLPPDEHVYAGEVTVSGSFGDVALEYLRGVGKYEALIDPRPPPTWEGGENVMVRASGGEFPAFDIAVDLPVPIPGRIGVSRPGTISFTWGPYDRGQVYLEAQRGSLESSLFALCTERSEVGSVTLPPAVEARFAPDLYFTIGGSRTIVSSCTGEAYVELVAHAEAMRGPVRTR